MFEANLADVVDQLVARGWKANAAKSAVDVCPVPLNPNVLLPLYASRLDYDGHGSLLVGLSNNKIVRLPMQPLVASGKLRPQVLVDGHTGYLRAVASLPTASLYFNLGVRMFGEEHVHVVGDGSSGQEIAEVVMKVFPFMESREVARDSVMEGNVVVMRPDPHGELKIFDPLVNDFREMENEEKSAIFRQDSQEVEPFEYMIADRSFQTPEVRIEKMEERNLPSRSSVVIKEMNTFDLDDARLPNARYAKQTGLVQVQVRSIQHDRDPIWSSTRKLQRLTGKNKSEKSVVGCCVQSGDVLVYRGALNTRMQTKLKQVISTITHTSTRHIVLHDVQPFLVEDEEGVHVTYNMLLRLRVPSNEHDCVVERIRRSMRERPNYWKMVREAFAIKNRALTKSPHITQHVAQCDFDKLMKEEGIPAEAQLLGRSFWRRREEQTSVLFSCGEDGTLCKWDPYQHVLLDSIYLPGFTGKDQRQWRRRATCMAVSPPRFGADRWVAVGHRMGTISILDAQDLSSLMVEIQDRSSDVRDIKFSSTGCMMAVGSSEGLIDLYSIQDAAGEDAVVVAWLAVCRGHTASVTHLDFSVDSRFLRSNDAGGEILYWHLVDENSPGQTLHFLQQQRDGIVRLLSKNLSHPAGKLRVRPAGIGRYSGAVNSRLLQHGHAAAGTMVKETSRLSSLDWSSSSCKLCWHLRSIWRPRSKLHHIEQVSVSYLEDVVACAYAPDFIRIGNFPDPFLGKEQAVTRFKAFAWRCLGSSTVNIEEEATKSFSVRADSKGVFSSSLLDRFTVKLFRFPCVGVPSSPFLRSCYLAGSSGVPGSGPSTMPAWYEAYPRSFSGHAGAVTAAEWAGEDLWLLTAGGADCSLLQWRHRRPLWKRWWLRRSRRQQQTLRQLFGKTVPRVTTELQGKEEGENIFEQLVSRACKDVGYLTGEEEVAKEKILDAMPKLMLLWSQFPEQAVELAFSSSSSSSITTCCMQEFTCAVAEEHVGHVAATFFDAVKEREGEEAVTCRVDELEEALSRKEGKKFLREMMQRDLPLPHLDQSCRCLQDVLRLVGGEEQEERSGKGMCSRRRFVSAMVTLQIKHTPSIKLQ
uniref:EML-like second beta-propeller domain-containing protein n=1 Tax=Guillardia theta TaxID=55529 RepID=A0A7S4L3Y8_GUITH